MMLLYLWINSVIVLGVMCLVVMIRLVLFLWLWLFCSMIVWFVCIVLSVVVMCGGIGLEFSNGRLVKVLVGVDEMDIKDM